MFRSLPDKNGNIRNNFAFSFEGRNILICQEGADDIFGLLMFDEMGEQLTKYFEVIEIPKGFETFKKTP